MKNIINKFKNIILIYVLIYLFVFVAFKFVLNIFNLNYREWIYLVSFIVIGIGFIVGIIQLLFKIKPKIIKIVSMIIFIIILIPYLYCSFLFGIFSFRPEHVVMKDGKKMLAYVDAFMETHVEYYNYKNFFLVGNKHIIIENYGNGGFDPIKNNYGYKYDVISTNYYDENGKFLRTESNESNNTNKYTNNNVDTSLQDVTQKILDNEFYSTGKIKSIDEENIYFFNNSRNYYINKNSFSYLNGRTFEEIELSDIKIGDFLDFNNKKILIFRDISGEELNQELLYNFTLSNEERLKYVNTIEIENINIENDKAIVKIKYGDIIGLEVSNEFFEILVEFNSDTKFYSKGKNINSINDLELARYNINSIILDRNTINKKNPAIVTSFESSDN